MNEYEAMALMQRGIAARDDLIQALRDVLEVDPIVLAVDGSITWCLWCHEGSVDYQYTHAADCEWVEARAKLAAFYE